MSFKVNVRLSDATTFEVDLGDVDRSTKTILAVKEGIAKHEKGCPAAEQKIVFKGRILKDADTFEVAGVFICGIGAMIPVVRRWLIAGARKKLAERVSRQRSSSFFVLPVSFRLSRSSTFLCSCSAFSLVLASPRRPRGRQHGPHGPKQGGCGLFFFCGGNGSGVDLFVLFLFSRCAWQWER